MLKIELLMTPHREAGFGDVPCRAIGQVLWVVHQVLGAFADLLVIAVDLATESLTGLIITAPAADGGRGLRVGARLLTTGVYSIAEDLGTNRGSSQAERTPSEGAELNAAFND
jgi:hypothetical protein